MHLHSHSLGHLVDWGRGTSRGEFAGIGVGSARAIQVGEKFDFTLPKMLVLPLVWGEILEVGRLWGHSVPKPLWLSGGRGAAPSHPSTSASPGMGKRGKNPAKGISSAAWEPALLPQTPRGAATPQGGISRGHCAPVTPSRGTYSCPPPPGTLC